jgi:hypothetical protein
MLPEFRAAAPRVVSGVATAAVAVSAGTISYQHIEDLSLSLHQTILAARLMPVSVDGLIAVGSMSLVKGGKLGWLGIGPGVAISVFANVESGIRYGWLAAIWAGIASVSFALATFILERSFFHQATPDAAQTVTETGTVSDTESEAELDQDDTETPPEEPETEISSRRIGMSLEEAAREFASEIETRDLVSLREIQTRCRTGRPRAQIILDHLVALMDARPVASVPASAENERERIPA